MPSPAWLGYAFAAVMMVDGAYCLARVVAGPRTGHHAHTDVDSGHVLMAVAMVGMLVPAWSVLPVAVWEAVFGVMALWFLVRSARAISRRGVAALAAGGGLWARHYLVHFVMACAMLDMYWLGMPMTAPSAMRTGAGMAMAPAGGGGPTLTAFLVLVMLASAAWQLDAVGRAAPGVARVLAVAGGGAAPGAGAAAPTGPPERVGRWHASGYEVGCHVAMCVTMAYMLVLML